MKESVGSRIYGRYFQTPPSYPHTNLSFLSSWLDSYRSKSVRGEEVRFVCRRLFIGTIDKALLPDAKGMV